MRLWNWLMVNCLGHQTGSENGLPTDKPKQKTLEFHPVEKEPKIPPEAPSLPNEMVMDIFDNFAADLLKNPSLESEGLKTLFRCAQVCKQWNLVAEAYFSKIYTQIMGEEKPDDMTGAQALGILYNWKKQEGKSVLTTAKPISGEFIPIDCHKHLDNPATTFDKIEVNGMRVLLNSKYLLSFNVVDESKPPQKAWHQKVENPERRILVSTDQQLIATQHYYSAKDKEGSKRLACRFDVRYLRTGQLLGQIKILCPEDKKIFDETNIQFDFKKFVYQKEGKERTRYYDPCFVVQKVKATTSLAN